MKKELEEKYNNQVETAIANKDSKNVSVLGKVNNGIVNEIKLLLGIDTTNRNHIVTNDDIRHMINEHGNSIVEAKKGQIAITIDDIKNIPNIIENYDKIVRGTNNKQGETIRYIKNANDGISYVVEIIPKKQNMNLKIKTMWKKHVAELDTNCLKPTSDNVSNISSTSDNIVPN